MHILVIEDQQDFAQNIRRYLETETYSVDLAFDGETGLHLGLTEEYALVVLDLNLPRMDGLEVCRQLRQAGRSMPILMLTARIGHKNAVAGLDSGADDYLTKPFDLEELLARMRALLRRGGETRSPVIDLGDISVDTNTHEVPRTASWWRLLHGSMPSWSFLPSTGTSPRLVSRSLSLSGEN